MIDRGGKVTHPIEETRTALRLMDAPHPAKEAWRHDHVFGQDARRPGEPRTVAVIALTSVMMVVEIAAGWLFGSMALLADGLHMASHAAALGISAFAYIYARTHAHDERFSFGTGKVNALGGFTGAVLLAAFAVAMAWESVHRLLAPVEIAFDHAIVVAIVGLLVNGGSMLILGHEEDTALAACPGEAGEHAPHAHDAGHARHHDHNLRAAYLHVVADALTSFLAIFALLAGKYLGQAWVDPVMGIVGGLLVARWSVTLLRSTSAVLLDRQAPPRTLAAVADAIQTGSGHRLVDLHVWTIGPGVLAAEMVVVASAPRDPQFYRDLLPRHLGLAHVAVEVRRCDGEAD